MKNFLKGAISNLLILHLRSRKTLQQVKVPAILCACVPLRPSKVNLVSRFFSFFNMAGDKVAFYVKLLQIELTCLVKQGLCGLFS